VVILYLFLIKNQGLFLGLECGDLGVDSLASLEKFRESLGLAIAARAAGVDMFAVVHISIVVDF